MRTETSWKRSLALELGAFGFFGLFWGCFAVLLAGLRTALGVVAAAGLAVFLLSLRLREPGEGQSNPCSRTP